MKTNLLFAVLAGSLFALAGCSPNQKPNAYPKYDAAVDFKDDAPANATVAGGFPSVFVDKDGKTIDLKSFRGKKSVVVVVLRGVPQSFGGAFCFHCLAQMSGLLAKKDEIARRGAEVVILFPAPPRPSINSLNRPGPRPTASPSCLTRWCSTKISRSPIGSTSAATWPNPRRTSSIKKGT